jgi:hypothetical protein
MQEDSDDKQKPDSRPGHYYVSALPGVGEAKDRYWLLAGPWPTHAEALAQVRPVWDYALRIDPVGATWKSFGTCRLEVVDGVEAAPSKLGNDAAVWTPRKPLGIGDAVTLVTDEKLRGIGSSTGAGDTYSGTVVKTTPRRVYVRFGWTGFGQRTWPFDDKGAALAPTLSSLGKCHLELA